MLESLKKIVASSDAAGQLIKGIREGNSFFLQPVPAGFLAMLISAVFRRTKRTVVVVAPEKTEDILADIELVEKRTLYFPAYDILPYDTNLPDTEIVARRIETVYRMRESPRQTIVTSPRALLEKSIPERLLGPIKIHKGETVELEELKAKLVENGYKSCDTTGYIGEFSSRGGILDIFTPGTVDPVRLEFFGDTVESIRLFSARNQRSIRKIKECTILPPTEAISLVRATRGNRIQEKMKRFQAEYKEAQNAGNKQKLAKLEEERAKMMSEQGAIMKQQIKPMMYITVVTLPIFYWIYLQVDANPSTILLPVLGERSLVQGVMGFFQYWIVWYILCSLMMSQVIRKVLDVGGR